MSSESFDFSGMLFKSIQVRSRLRFR